MVVVGVVKQRPDTMVHRLNSGGGVVKRSRHGVGKSPKIPGSLLHPGMQVNPVDKFPPAHDLPDPSFDAGEGGLGVLGMVQALPEHIVDGEQSVVKQWGDG